MTKHTVLAPAAPDLGFALAGPERDVTIDVTSSINEYLMRADWRVNETTSLWLAADNLFDAEVEVSETGNGVAGYGPPRLISLGLRLTY